MGRNRNSSSGPSAFMVSSATGAVSTATRLVGRCSCLASAAAPSLSSNAIAVATQAPQARHAARYLMGSGS